MKPVVVVGAGPTGLTAAVLLQELGVPVVVLERHAAPYALPRAVHLDDEVHRVLQAAGVADAFAGVSRAALGLRLVDAQHRVMAEFRRPARGAHGWPGANLFDQPDLEALLRARLAAPPRTATVTGVRAGAAPVVETDGGDVEASAVFGCDGAGSTVRAAVGARWDDLGFSETWLVVDVLCEAELPVWDGVTQVCDPARAATVLRVGRDRYRWEFQLRDGEADLDVGPLLAPWTGGREVRVVRRAAYGFAARLADRWQEGRTFLLGDAAHVTPPFVGQGLGAGLRDAHALAWRLARVLHGRAPEALLATYAQERRPHARAQVRQAVTAGWAMTGGQDRAAAVRRAVLAGVVRVPGGTALLDRGSPALRGSALTRGRSAGALPPQPGVAGRRLDDVVGPRFAVLTTGAVTPGLQAVADRLEGVALALGAAPADPLSAWLRRRRHAVVVLRPDRAVLAAARDEAGLRVPWGLLTDP